MQTTKTAISVPTPLFEQAERIARDLHVSRSRIFVMALEKLIRDYQEKELLEQINQAVRAAAPDKAERTHLEQIRQHQRRMVKGTW